MQDILDFIVAAGFAGGGSVILAIVLLIIAIIEHRRDHNVPAAWLFIVACIAFCFGGFCAWQSERDRANVLSEDKKNLGKQIDDLSKSNISADIQFAILGQQTIGSHAGIIVSLRNDGAPAAIIPDSWNLVVVTPDGNSHVGSASTLKDKNLDFCINGNSIRRFVKKDALYLKAMNPIARNGFEQGFLWFGLPDLNTNDLKNPETELKLTAKTVSGQDFHTEISVQELIRRSSEPAKFFAGIENPNPIPGRCQDTTRGRDADGQDGMSRKNYRAMG